MFNSPSCLLCIFCCVPLLQGTGEAQCSNPSISWRPDGFVYGGTGSARISEGADRGCNTQIRVIDEVLQPCCKPMADLIGGPSGLAAKAPKGSIQAKAYQYLLSKVKVGLGVLYVCCGMFAVVRLLLYAAARDG
jgi:hypothetical protein